MMSSSSSTASVNYLPTTGGSNSTNKTIAAATTTTSNYVDPYLTDDFHPLALASSEILSALREDESAPDGDLYRRLISSSRAGAHRYHAVKGEDGCGEIDGSSFSSSSGGGGMGGIGVGRQQQQGLPTPPRGGTTVGGSTIGSPLGMLRGSRSGVTATTGGGSSSSGGNRNNAATTDDPTTASASSSPAASSCSPPTSFLRYEKSIPLPNHLSVEAKKAQLSSMMGLLPEANLVWLSADEKLFLWSYQATNTAFSSSFLNNVSSPLMTTKTTTTTTVGGLSQSSNKDKHDYCTFTVPSGQCIVSVGLVRPKPGVFHPTTVEWCVVVTTPEEVILCALAKEDLNTNNVNPDEEEDEMVMNGGRGRSSSLLRLIPTRYVLPTDSIPIMSIAGTSGGRIFLGGYDGNLYEMVYEGQQRHSRKYQSSSSSSVGHLSGSESNEALEAAIDDYFDGGGVFTLNTAGEKTKNNDSLLSFSGALSGGKRVFSALTFGSLDDDNDDTLGSTITNGIRSKKCRKINHSSTASSLVTSVVPGAIIRVASGIFGSSMHAVAKGAGPIVNMVVDEERFCLYTLGAKGIICSYDILPLSNTFESRGKVGSTSTINSINAPRLASVFDSIASAKLYLDSVSRGRMYPPSTSQNIALGTITFPGGEASAQAGVGGMEGAREILKRHEWEGRAMKATTASLGSTGGAGLRGLRDHLNTSNTAGILHPVSIHIVPTTESKSLTLLAITGGGLRYYLSSLSSSCINSAQTMRGGFDYGARGVPASSKNMDPRLARMRPSTKMTFCHIRAPPPYTSTEGNDGFRFELAPSAVNLFSVGAGIGGLPPGIHSVAGNAAGDVVKGSYSNGVFVLALDVEKKLGSSKVSGRSSFSTVLGDVIVVAMPDFAVRDSSLSNSTLIPGSQMTLGNATNLAVNQAIPGGISEAILLPIAGIGGTSTPALPGGRTFDIVINSGSTKSSITSLFMNSETPSDGELQVGLMPAFFPQKKVPQRSSSSPTKLFVWNDGRRGMISSALSALAHYLRSGKGVGNLVGTVLQGNAGLVPSVTYRISRRHGCNSVGFSSSAGESLSMSSRPTRADTAAPTKSARLPSWLMHPSPAPLNSLATHHILFASAGATSSQSVLILNSGGLHFFSNVSVLNNLATVLLRTSNVAKDGMVKNFFTSYGYAEGCAMCFALATSCSSSEVLRNKAENAALSYAHRPMMKLSAPSAGDGMSPITSYTFQPSSLYEGLVKAISRLLRPFWYKPAVVVTEGRPMLSKSIFANYYASLPAKVELLLDDDALESIRRPLLLLQNLMKRTFVRAVQSIPGLSTNDHANDAMDVDKKRYNEYFTDSGLITIVMQNRSRAVAAAQRFDSSQYASSEELRTTAFRTEERNMHSLYRLLSRCVHLLNLMACLRRAHETSSLPEVQWGLLHGLTFYQLITSQEGHQRIETLLNSLVSQGDKISLNGLSPDGDLLAESLARHCYLFFSSASRLTYLGFRSANDALSRPIASPQRLVLSNQAAAYLRAASRHWYTPALVAGRLLSKNESQSWDEVATNAKEAGSPLALAADILMKLSNVHGLVDVCLICAANFGGSKVPRDEGKELGEDLVQNMLDWERGLYHRPRSEASGNDLDVRTTGTQAIVTGIDVTAADALRACHSIIFHYVSKLLGEASGFNQRLADELVATCAASSDHKFVHSLYEHLLATNNAETALRINNPSIENWLLHEKKDVSLVWKYYTLHSRNVLAGDIMWRQALNSDDKVPLEQRIECLARAANSYSLALDPSGHGMIRMLREEQVTTEMLQSRIAQIKEQLEVATIQKLILTTIIQSQDVNLEQSKMVALSYTLMNVSELYNEFACPLNLFNVCLLILETCRHNDNESISTLWKSIICEEILPCQTNSEAVVDFLTRLKQGSMLEEETIMYGVASSNDAVQQFENGEWIIRLRNRVASLGKELYGKGADYTFPLDLIVTQLEGEIMAVWRLGLFHSLARSLSLCLIDLRVGLRQTYDQFRGEDHTSFPWPAQTVLEVGVPFYLLLGSYDTLLHDTTSIGGIDNTMR